MQVVGDGEHETMQYRRGGQAASVTVIMGKIRSTGAERTGRWRKDELQH